jgi:hypothetical protein
MGITALWIATGKGNLDLIKLLLKHGADANARDGIWYETPLLLAVQGGYTDVVKLLLKSGAKDVDGALLTATGMGKLDVLETLLDSGKVHQDALDAALAGAGKDKVKEALRKAGAKPLKSVSAEHKKAWAALAGTYESDGGSKLTVEVRDTGVVIRGSYSLPQVLRATGGDTFVPVGIDATSYRFERKGKQVVGLVWKRHTAEYNLFRSELKPQPKPTTTRDDGTVNVATPANWPSFRGPFASGVADGQQPPVSWDVKKGTNLRWKTAVPGLGHSCPVVWGNRVFLTTAISGDPNPKVRTGNYGDVESVNDTTKHRWQVLCLDRDTGKVLWTRTAFEGVPKVKRHLKGSQANCTPATDGKRVVACFGSEGLYCYDFSGKQLWKRDLGTLDSSFRIDREYQWGFGSSPILHEGLVILQCDLGKGSFLAAYRLDDGSRVWSTPRDEIPSWSTPTVWRNSRRVEIVTNAAS